MSLSLTSLSLARVLPVQAPVPVLLFAPAELESVRGMLAAAAEPVLTAAAQHHLAAAEQLCRCALEEALLGVACRN